MKLPNIPSPLFLLLLPVIFPHVALATADAAPAIATSKAEAGTLYAPVDGKDGKPHAGPWVETAAERDRKLAKIAGDDDAPSKPVPTTLRDTPLSTTERDGWKLVPAIPESNDGVMDDPNRILPKEGTRGTEGGVSEKSRDRQTQGRIGTKPDKKPDPPKEAPPLPHSEQEKLAKQEGKETFEKGSGTSTEEPVKEKPLNGLEKPTDLPEKPHDIPYPMPASSVKDDPLNVEKPIVHTGPGLPPGSVQDEGIIQPLHSFLLSFSMIIFSEIGDKTFLIAALMAMKHPRLLVFSSAFCALLVMTVLSAIFGHAVPTLLPQKYTHLAATVLFFVFGAKMLREGLEMSPDDTPSEEMKEVEMELEEKAHQSRKMNRRRSSISPYILESGRAGSRKTRSNSRLPSPPASPSSSSSRSPSPSPYSSFSNLLAGFHNLFSFLLSPAWVQTFIMTFLGEWGDRSQIATIAMAAGQDYWWVTCGAIFGHSLCTAGAVIGGRAIAGRVSLRVVTIGGAIAFLFFGLVYMIETIY